MAFADQAIVGKRINLDEIVRRLGDWRDEKLQITAGKQAVRFVRQCLKDGVSFHQETTLAGKSIFRTIRDAKAAGFEVVMYYIGVNSAEIAKERVRTRIQKGGHGVDNALIEKRFFASLEHLKLAIPLCDVVRIYDNSEESSRYVLLIEQGIIKKCESVLPQWLATALADLKISTMKYKDFLGSVQYSVEDECYFGKILSINDLYSYEGSDTIELENAFHEAVDEYLNNK